MPRAPARIRKRYVEGTEVLCSEIEETLVFGQGVLGVAIQLRSLDEWKRYWSLWRDTIMPKALEALPGRRPFACYVVGEIPPRPIVTEPPLSNGYFKHYVPGNNGTGQWHCQEEAHYLYDLGLIDADEMKRYRASLRKPVSASALGNRYAVGEYVCEMGLHV